MKYIKNRTANSSVYPTKQVLDLKPDLVHRVKWDWGTTFLMHELYQVNDWLKKEPTVTKNSSNYSRFKHFSHHILNY